MISRRISRITATALLATLFLPLTVHGGSRQRAVAVSPSVSALSIAFLDGASATAIIDAGTTASKRGRRRVTLTTRTFAIRIGAASREARETATLRAFLETPDPRAAIRIDGIPLGATPVVIRHRAPLGIAETHILEIEVPVTAPAGPLAAAIGWEATTE